MDSLSVKRLYSSAVWKPVYTYFDVYFLPAAEKRVTVLVVFFLFDLLWSDGRDITGQDGFTTT
jgi:hypothetical protein